MGDTTKRSQPDDSSHQEGQRRKLCLMIHAIDGCVPFLTPDILEKHFPPSEDFWIGMAVRDTCVHPFFHDKKKNTKKKKTAFNEQTKSLQESKKPRGYSFLSTPPDRWLLPYTRVTVPSFDWMEDNLNMKRKKDQRPVLGSTSSNDHILVWTPHGRQKLTPDLYANASIGLQSRFTLSLYDMIEEKNKKRTEKANVRNKEWLKHLIQLRQKTSVLSESLWSPILLSNAEDMETTKDMQLHHEFKDDVAGVALIGRWQTGLEHLLKSKLEGIPYVSILRTTSLLEILNIVESQIVNVIGTDLPSLWANKKKALAITVHDKSIDTKRQKMVHKEDLDTQVDADGCLDMADTSYSRDTRSIIQGCKCLACADNRFSRSYIHHLICAKELLAEILLFSHNLHCLLDLIRSFNRLDDIQYGLKSVRDRLAKSSHWMQ